MLTLRFVNARDGNKPRRLPFSFALCCLAGVIGIDLLCRHMHQCTLTESDLKSVTFWGAL